MNTTAKNFAAFACLAAVLAACSGGAGTFSTTSAAYTVSCVQKASNPDGSDSDCTAKGLPRKLDCDDAASKQEAIAQGCQEEKPGDMDVCCPTTVVGKPPPSPSSSSSSGSSSGATCDLKKENWYSECSKGCGDVMVCQSFCSTCTKKCMAPCETNADCEAVGAGSCEISAKASNRCSGPPTKCK